MPDLDLVRHLGLLQSNWSLFRGHAFSHGPNPTTILCKRRCLLVDHGFLQDKCEAFFRVFDVIGAMSLV